ncbi:MAG: aminoacetone oxidase family FAD-binding enzyme [Actinobacteria bacterium]|nr:MAG: aminoacetone oxidase family FAD-binding enzyme [Actinomycetota bacterium]
MKLQSSETPHRAITRDSMHQPSIAIIGGGAAGLSAAIAAARLGASVTVLEAAPRVGKKILVTGNGRCNLTNTAVAPAAYNQPAFVEPVLAEYNADAIRDFFGELGLLTYADDEGRVYPVSNAANSVLDVLRLECAHLGVAERCGFEVMGILEADGGFQVASRDGETISADAVVVTTGGGEGSLLSALGHGSVAPVPVLGPLTTELAPIRGLSGVRVRCAASLLDDAGEPVATERGELLFRDYGVSGIMIFDLSRALERGRTLSIDFFPDIASDAFAALIAKRCAELSWRSADTFFDGMLQSRVAIAVLRAAGIDPKTPVAELRAVTLASLLKDFRLAVTGRGDASQAQVTRGGAPVAEFDPRTLASRIAPGVFAAGEVLDVDGRCGGFNLHWAWASGIVAGQSAVHFATRGDRS